MSNTDGPSHENCDHHGEPGALPLAHLVLVLQGFRNRIDRDEMTVKQVRHMLDGAALYFSEHRLDLLAEQASGGVVSEFERVLAGASGPEQPRDGV